MLSSRRFRVAALALSAVSALSACGAAPAVERSVAARQARLGAGGTDGGTSLPGGALPGQPLASSGALAGGPITAGASAAAVPLGGAAPGAAPDAGTGPNTGAATSSCGAAAPAGGNGGATDTGVTATSIKVGGTFLNGSYLDKYSQVAENAARAYFSYINGLGGICGRQIQYVTCDTAGTADGTSGCLNKLADQEKVFIMGPSLDLNLDIVQKGLAQRKLPWVGTSGLYDAEFESPWMFPTQAPGLAIGAFMTTYAVTKLGSRKIGVSVLRGADGPGCAVRVKKTAAANGAAVVATAENNMVETSLDNQVMTLKNAGAETVEFCNDPINTIKFIQAAQRSGWKPKFVAGWVAADDVPMAAGSNAKGMYGATMYDFYHSQSPGVQKYRQITEYYYPNTFHHFYEQAAYVGAEAVVAAIRAAGPKLTRTAFLTQLRGMRNFDSGLGLKLDFGNLYGMRPSGLMLQADDNLAWKIVSPRFSTPS